MVLNLHKAVGNYCDIAEKVQLLDDKGLQDRFVALWLEFERCYHGKPGSPSSFNEVRNVDPEKWNALADRTLKAIRERNPARWVVVGSTCWNAAGTLDKLKIWDDDGWSTRSTCTRPTSLRTSAACCRRVRSTTTA